MEFMEMVVGDENLFKQVSTGNLPSFMVIYGDFWWFMVIYGDENLFKQVSTGNLPSFLSRSFGGFVLYTTHWKEYFGRVSLITKG